MRRRSHTHSKTRGCGGGVILTTFLKHRNRHFDFMIRSQVEIWPLDCASAPEVWPFSLTIPSPNLLVSTQSGDLLPINPGYLLTDHEIPHHNLWTPVNPISHASPSFHRYVSTATVPLKGGIQGSHTSPHHTHRRRHTGRFVKDGSCGNKGWALAKLGLVFVLHGQQQLASGYLIGGIGGPTVTHNN